MNTEGNAIRDLTTSEYKYGFVSEIEADAAPRGLNEDTVSYTHLTLPTNREV